MDTRLQLSDDLLEQRLGEDLLDIMELEPKLAPGASETVLPL